VPEFSASSLNAPINTARRLSRATLRARFSFAHRNQLRGLRSIFWVAPGAKLAQLETAGVLGIELERTDQRSHGGGCCGQSLEPALLFTRPGVSGVKGAMKFVATVEGGHLCKLRSELQPVFRIFLLRLLLLK